MNPLFIIGAPRSGTNLLRNLLNTHPDIVTWPCDEINYIFRHGSLYLEDDFMNSSHSTPYISNYIRTKFSQIAKSASTSSPLVLEKTCANCLRVDFLHSIFPQAKYLYISRNPCDVVPSAMKRWRSTNDSQNIAYVLNKLRFMPLRDAPYHLSSILQSYLHSKLHPDKCFSYWGPRVNLLLQNNSEFDLESKCVIQWLACTRTAERDLDRLVSASMHKVHSITYEQLVLQPYKTIINALDYLGLCSFTRNKKFHLRLRHMCDSVVFKRSPSNFSFSPQSKFLMKSDIFRK